MGTWRQAVSLAKELNDMHALVLALYWAGHLAYFADNPAEVERLASDMMERSTRQNVATWYASCAGSPGLGAKHFR